MLTNQQIAEKWANQWYTKLHDEGSTITKLLLSTITEAREQQAERIEELEKLLGGWYGFSPPTDDHITSELLSKTEQYIREHPTVFLFNNKTSTPPTENRKEKGSAG